MRRISGLLKNKAIASLRRMVTAFNGLDDEGRQTSVLVALQHAFEMLLKAALRERDVTVFVKRTGRSIGFEKCLRLAREHLKLTEEQLGMLRAIDALRDDEQHWLAQVNSAGGPARWELDPAYCDVIVDRWERLTGRAPELLERHG